VASRAAAWVELLLDEGRQHRGQPFGGLQHHVADEPSQTTMSVPFEDVVAPDVAVEGRPAAPPSQQLAAALIACCL
jgi:hypothetical protein